METSIRSKEPLVAVVGAGLAGSEAAWQLAQRGVQVRLYEIRPTQSTPAHTTGLYAELVCSNSFKSLHSATAAGCLKAELALLGSFVLRCAMEARVPAGAALAVDRTLFAKSVTEALQKHPLIEIVSREVKTLDELTEDGCEFAIIATGPLTSDAFAACLGNELGQAHLSFFDAAAPIVMADSLDYQALFAQSRYDKSADTISSDYLNAPFTKESYDRFITELVKAERVIMRDFERKEFFKACQPIEELARTGNDALRFGALKPVGLTDPATGKRPWAAVQLRAENHERTAYNLVGFQTNLTFPEQKRVFRLIPGLEQAEFARYGVMHRNTFVNAPQALGASFEIPNRPQVILAGQLTGTEGYTEAIASGLLAALTVYSRVQGLEATELPRETCFGALVAYATDPKTTHYQPMHVNFGLLPALEPLIRKKEIRYEAFFERALTSLTTFINEHRELGFQPSFELPLVLKEGAEK